MNSMLSTYIDPESREMAVNFPHEVLSRPTLGPANPNHTHKGFQNTLTGHIEQTNMSDFMFEIQRRTFTSYGYAVDPSDAYHRGEAQSSELYIGNKASFAEKQGATVINKIPGREKSLRKRKEMGEASDVEGFKGPWAGYEDENVGDTLAGPAPEALAKMEDEKAKLRVMKHTRDSEYIQPGMEKSIFHGKMERDYMGRTYMHIPNDVDIDLKKESGTQVCYLPKTLLHTWNGHSKGVTAIRFLPGSAHLLLSSSMDAKIKIWDVYHERRCLRTFIGHNKAVRDVSFRPDGRQFVSAGYDKYIKLWDTETGKCLKSFEVRATPYCVKFHPDSDKPTIFLAGCANKRIYQWDTDVGEIVQEYNQHLEAVNTITFVDENRRFVTTSDDKTIRVWDYDIPVVIKNIAEPHMHSMPSVAVHPNKKWFAAQSLDNQILVYSTTDRFSLHRKRFAGHIVAGYACQVNFSPDGQYVMSGDGEGKLWFWNWKTGRIAKTLKCHDKVTIDCQWHPHETSKVATCSWDGTIKLWD